VLRKIDLANFQVATSGTARDINRRIVLNLIRKLQPISRADIARCSGLQRSTVSSITEQLISERWVTEGALGNLPRGRKPTFLHWNGSRAGVIGVDLRPQRTTIGLATLDSRFISQEYIETGQESERFIEELSEHIRMLMKAHPGISYEGIGVALPGRIDLSTNRLVFAPNLGWRAVDLKTPLEKATGLPVELENAANACALAELWSDRYPEGLTNLVAVTISEGIGVGLILNRQLVRGASGMAGEFGHVTLQEDGPICRCGNHGCWEMCASNSAAIRYYGETIRSKRSSRFAPSFEDILRLAEQGDTKAGEVLDKMAYFVGAGLAILVTGLTPDVVVLIGEFTRAWARVGPIVNDVIKQRLPTKFRTRIIPTDPDTQPRLRGTITLALQKHFGAPV